MFANAQTKGAQLAFCLPQLNLIEAPLLPVTRQNQGRIVGSKNAPVSG